MEKEFENLLSEVRSYNKKADINKIRKAWEYAKLAHSGQKRLSGDPYVLHLLAAACILGKWRLDTTSIIAALLHDTVEDGGATKQDIEDRFGRQVAFLVDGVTKVSDLKLGEKKSERTVENLRKLILVMAKDLRVVFVKLADRLHNMQTLEYLPDDKKRKIARETLEIYAPLAGRMGMGEVKGELEDLSFQYLYPKEFKKVIRLSKSEYKKSERHIKRMRRSLLIYLAKEDVIARINARKKHYYSLYKKLSRKGIDGDFLKIHDIVAMRIIVATKENCYLALGVIHDHYKPVPHLGISDYIAQPKPNGYQSIHTKVFGPENNIVEVQIRTSEMHEHAEHGVAAHWAYGEFKSKMFVRHEEFKKKKISTDPQKLMWVKELAKWQEEITESAEFMRAVKFDALSHRNFVFSPKGDVFDLPVGATPVDFAAAVHTKLIDFIKLAKVNGKIVPLDHELKSGDVVEIVKTKNKKKPNKDWLRFVKTQNARRVIRKNLRN